MERLNLYTIPRIWPRFSWVDWGLNDVPAAVNAANQLNGILREEVNTGSTRDQVLVAVEAVMAEFPECGGVDAIQAHLYDVVDTIFGGG